MSKWPNGAKLLERMEDAEDGGLNSRQISKTSKEWCRKYTDLDPSKISIGIEAYTVAHEAPDDPTRSADMLQEWVSPKALADGVCYFALADELEGYPVKVMRLFRKGKQYVVLFDLLDYVPWDEAEEEDE
jgi:hypothetical protein